MIKQQYLLYLKIKQTCTNGRTSRNSRWWYKFVAIDGYRLAVRTCKIDNLS